MFQQKNNVQQLAQNIEADPKLREVSIGNAKSSEQVVENEMICPRPSTTCELVGSYELFPLLHWF